MATRMLITGADGMAGCYADFGTRTNRESLDILDLENVLRVGRAERPGAIIHLAAETDMARCEREPDHAYRVNSAGTYHMAVLARELGAKMVYVSTAGVFDGLKSGFYNEDDPPNPQSVYGKSKFIGECIVRGMLDDFIIARTCWLFGGGSDRDKKFVAKIIRQFDTGKVEAVRDQRGSPTYAKDLVGAIRDLVQNDAKGIFHIVNSGACSRYNVACEAKKILGVDVPITPVSSDRFPSDVPRIMNQSLSSATVVLRPWQDALREYLENEWK